jgi:hypothetical protein
MGDMPLPLIRVISANPGRKYVAFPVQCSLTSINIAKVIHWLSLPQEEKKHSPYYVKELILYGTIAA